MTVGARGYAQRWADTWSTAWPLRDAEAITALQAHDGTHWSSPQVAHLGRDGLRSYLLASFTAETAPTTCTFAAPVVDGDRAAVEYLAHVEYDGEAATISGCTVLEFDATGLVVRSRDYSFFEARRLPGVLSE